MKFTQIMKRTGVIVMAVIIVLVVSILLTIGVLVLSLYVIRKGYAYKHKIDPIEDNDREQNNNKLN